MLPENVTPVFKCTRRIQATTNQYRFDAQLAAKGQLKASGGLSSNSGGEGFVTHSFILKNAVTHMPVRKLGLLIKAHQSFFC